MNTQGVGIHPDGGTLQPLGARANPCPLCTHMDGKRVDPQGMAPSSSDGYYHTRPPLSTVPSCTRYGDRNPPILDENGRPSRGAGAIGEVRREQKHTPYNAARA